MFMCNTDGIFMSSIFNSKSPVSSGEEKWGVCVLIHGVSAGK